MVTRIQGGYLHGIQLFLETFLRYGISYRLSDSEFHLVIPL